MASEWISTGEAARLLGYSRDQFRRKFQGVIPHRRIDGGHLRWLREAVERLAAGEPNLPDAS